MPAQSPQPGIVPRTMRKLSEKGAAQLSDAAQRALVTTRAAGAAVALLDGQEMFTCTSCGESVPPAGARSSVSGFTGLAIQKRETLVCDDTQADSRVDATVCKGLNVRSMAVAPIKVNGIIEGVFAIFFSSPRAVSRMHVAMLRTLADAAAVVLEREPAGETQFLAKNSVAPAPVEPAAPADFPVVPNPADLPAALHEITDEEIAEVVDLLCSEPVPTPPVHVATGSGAQNPGEPTAPVEAKVPTITAKPELTDSLFVEPHAPPGPVPKPPASVGAQPPAPSLFKRDDVEVLPAAADPVTKPLPATGAGVGLQSKDIPAARIKADSSATLKVTPQAPLFQAFARDTLRRQRTRRIFLPVGGVAAVVIAVAGFMLYRSPGVKATSDNPATVISDASPESVPNTPPRPQETVSVDAPERTAAHSPENVKRSEPAKPVAAETPAPAPAAMVVRASTTETRATIKESELVEPPTLSVAPSGSNVALPPPAAGAPAAPRGPVVEPAVLIQKTRVGYPQFARARRLQGTVVLQIKISKDGKVVQASRIAGDPVLGLAAADAVKSWRYQPAKRDSVPIESDAQVSIVFHLGAGAQ